MRPNHPSSRPALIARAALTLALAAALAGCVRTVPGYNGIPRRSPPPAWERTSPGQGEATLPAGPTLIMTPQSPALTVVVTPAASPAPAGTLSPEAVRTLSYFPLEVGNSWIYRLEAGKAGPGTPTPRLTHAWIMTDTVAEVRQAAGLFAARIQHDVALTTGTASTAPDFGLTRAGEFWYIVRNNQVFRQEGEPDWTAEGPGQVPGPGQAVLSFPLEGEGPERRTLPAGPVEGCYTFESVGVERAFCLGLGFAAGSGEEAGSRYRYELTGYLLQN